MSRYLSITIVAVALAAAAAGCGSSSKSSSATSSASGAATHASSSGSQAAQYPASSSAPAAAQPVALIATKHDKLGTILAYGPKQLTVYLFEGDKGAASSCTGACAQAWPPVTGSAKAGGGAVAADLGTIKRSDGSTQVTYKGHPLYVFVKDQDAGDAYGQGIKAFGADWYALDSTGTKVDQS